MRTESIGAFEAKTRLAELLERVTQGRTYTITRRGKPVAELRPVSAPKGRFYFGCDKGAITMSKDFDAPLPDWKEYLS